MNRDTSRPRSMGRSTKGTPSFRQGPPPSSSGGGSDSKGCALLLFIALGTAALAVAGLTDLIGRWAV